MELLAIYFFHLLQYNNKRNKKIRRKRMQNMKIDRNAESIGVVHTHTHTQVRLEK